MDSKDYQIIAALQANGRMTNQELSEQVSLTPTPCLRRLRMLEESGMIRGYTAVVDEEAFGLPVTAFVGVKLKEHTADAVRKFERAIQAVDAVLDCYVMTGQVDYLLRVLTQSLKDYERFVRQELHAIPGIQSIDTSFAYGRVKRSVVFPSCRSSVRSELTKAVVGPPGPAYAHPIPSRRAAELRTFRVMFIEVRRQHSVVLLDRCAEHAARCHLTRNLGRLGVFGLDLVNRRCSWHIAVSLYRSSG